MPTTARVSHRLAIVAFLMTALGMSAQQTPTLRTPDVNSGPSGTVTGTVYAQDTRRPIRFAQVQLQSVAAGTNAAGGRSSGGSARTEVDGTFTVTDVAPGDYYVTASALGYVLERSLLIAAVANGADPAQFLAGLPRVHVDAGGMSSVNVSLQRGGTVEGRVVWEDGSPAAGLSILAVDPAAPTGVRMFQLLQSLPQGGFGLSTTTDDRGEFRISGLPSSDYQLQAVLQVGGQVVFGGGRGGGVNSSLRVYAPGVFRKSAAKSYSVRAGEERTDVRLVIDLRSLRSVSGHVNSSDAGQSVASGRVTLTDAADPSLVLRGTVVADGSFSVRYVPPGNYVLAISGASTNAQAGNRGWNNGSTTPNVSFQPLSQPIVVTDADLSGFTATLVPVQSH